MSYLQSKDWRHDLINARVLISEVRFGRGIMTVLWLVLPYTLMLLLWLIPVRYV
jgi:hypothetical protein